MSTKAAHTIVKFTRKWQFVIYLEAILIALGCGVCVYLASNRIDWSLLCFLVIAVLVLINKKPWLTSNKLSTAFIDTKLEQVEYSSGLLLESDTALTGIAKLQRSKITNELERHIKKLQPPNTLVRTSIISVLLILLGYIAYMTNLKDIFNTINPSESPAESVVFQAMDSVDAEYIPPKLIEQNLSINYPTYTKLPVKNTTDMNVSAVEGSRIIWYVKFDKPVKSVHLESADNIYDLVNKDGVYSGGTRLSNSGFYNFKFIDTLDQAYTSTIYAINVTQDQDPEIELHDLAQFTSFNYFESKVVDIKATIIDDFGLGDAYIIATVSKGSGESVKFREEKLMFNAAITKGNKTIDLNRNINLDAMNMEPGDELYFYVEAVDLKQPEPNVARSETYFATINDTISDQFSVEGTLGVDRMPDYFRSQRQLIIDTEKLIANKANLSEYDFKFTSNELGFDQKALRLKYSAFMGEETENVDLVEEDNIEALEEDHEDHDHEEDADPLAEYTHDHDNENEHNLVDEEGNEEEDPLEEYVHNHEDPEAATLFEESLKTKLLKALQQMWDSELQLRLYKPEASLPHQYEALKYLQDIKNSARIYVHRIGFDPPPIKEESRLTGDLDEVNSFSKREELKFTDPNQFMRQAILRLEQLQYPDNAINDADRYIFEQAGNELALIAIDNPGSHLKTLQQLKQLTSYGDKSVELLEDVQSGLLRALPPLTSNPYKNKGHDDELNKLLLKELQLNER